MRNTIIAGIVAGLVAGITVAAFLLPGKFNTYSLMSETCRKRVDEMSVLALRDQARKGRLTWSQSEADSDAAYLKTLQANFEAGCTFRSLWGHAGR